MKNTAIIVTEAVKKLLIILLLLGLYLKFICLSYFLNALFSFFFFVFWPVSFFRWFQIVLESVYLLYYSQEEICFALFLKMFLTTLFLNVVNTFIAIANLVLTEFLKQDPSPSSVSGCQNLSRVVLFIMFIFGFGAKVFHNSFDSC